ncbi:MAG: hypothetical protein GXN92_03410 [Candidatus Micrarchaeota archaeon]|nr:hypothetical protein [Candidatus Micrarchaeota archaeon]
MYILFSLLFMMAFAAQPTQLTPYSEQTLPVANITYTYYNPVVIPLANGSVNITIFRYVYPIISGEIEANLTEWKKRSLEEVQCYSKLDDVPPDFAKLFEKKLELETMGNNYAQAYIYEVVLWAHPYNNKTGCIPAPYQYPLNYTVITYNDNYIVELKADPSDQELIIYIPELSLNLTNKPTYQYHHLLFTSYTPPAAKTLTLQIKSNADLPFLATIFQRLKEYYDELYNILQRPYLALGLLLGGILAFLIILNGLLSFLSVLIPGLIRKEKNVFQKALGYHDTEALKKLVMGVIFILAGIYIEDNFSKKVYLQKISYGALIDLASLDLFFVISMVLYILGVVWIVDFVKDFIKGLIGGKAYYSAYRELISASTLKRMLEDLKHKIAEFREEIGKGLVEGIDVSDYLEEINAIPIHSLEAELERSSNLYPIYTKIKNYIQRVDELQNKYERTYNDVMQSYPFWREQVKNEIKKYGSVSIDGLTMVPAGWRYWFAKKFVGEYPEFVIEENVIKKLNLPKKELLKMRLRQFFEDHPESAILMEDGTFFYEGPKKTLTKAILTKLLLSEKSIEAESDLYRLKTFNKYNIRVIVFARKEDMDKLKGGFYGL